MPKKQILETNSGAQKAERISYAKDILEIDVVELDDGSHDSIENVVFTRSTTTSCSTS